MKLMISAEDKKNLRDFHYTLEFSGKTVLASVVLVSLAVLAIRACFFKCRNNDSWHKK